MRPVASLILVLLLTQSVYAQQWRDLFNQSQTHISNGNFDEALKAADSALKDYMDSDGSVSSNYAAILHTLVQVNYELESYSIAVTHGEKELIVLGSLNAERDATFAGAYYNLGSAYFMNDQFEQASGSFLETLTIYKGIYEENNYERLKTEWKLASSLYFDNKKDEAQKYFEDSFSLLVKEDIDGEYLEAAYYFGELLTERKDYKSSAPLLTELESVYNQNLLKQDPAYPLILRMLCLAKINIGDGDSKTVLENAISFISTVYSDSELSSFLNEWAAVLQEEGHTEQAELLLQKVGENQSGDANSLNNLATVAYNNQDYEKAADLYVEALSVATDNQQQYAGIAENLVVLLETIGDLSNAEKYQQEALEIYTNSQHPKAASAKSVLGRIKKLLGDYEEAFRLYSEAIPLMDSESAEYAEALNGLASLYQQTGSYQQADSAYQLSIISAQKHSERTYAAVLNNLGSYYKEIGKYLMARNQFYQALEAVDNIYSKKSVPYINTLQNLSLLELELGSYERSINLIEEAKTIATDLFGTQDRIYSQVLLNEGRILLAQGKYSEAEPIFKEVVSIRTEIYGTSSEPYAEAVNSLAFFYQTLGNFQEAEPLFEEAISTLNSSSGKESINYSTALENLASLYQMQGYYSKAEPLLKECLAIDKELLGKEHPLYSTTLHNLASLYKELGKLDESESLFREALEIDKNAYGERHPGFAKTLYNLAALLQDKGEFEEAEKLYQKVADIRLEILGENHPDYAFTLYGMASIKRVLNKPEALDYYTRSIEKYLNQIKDYFPAMSEKEKSAFYEKIKPVFESFKDYAIEQALEGNESVLETLYDLQLSTKALLLNSSSKVRRRILASGDVVLKSQFQAWLTKKELLVKYSALTIDELKLENIDLNQLVIDANSLEKDISGQSELFAKEIEKSTTRWIDVRDQLESGEAVIEILRVEKTFNKDSVLYAAMVLKGGSSSPKLAVFKLGNQLETRMFNYYRNAIRFTVGDEISYTNYWKALLPHLDGIETLYISTDGIFNKISFNTLWDHIRNMYVIDEYKVRILSNSRELVERTVSTTTSNNSAGVFGNPDFGPTAEHKASLTRTSNYGFSSGVPSLPGSKEEVEKLSATLDQYDWTTSIFVENQASEENFKKIDSPRLLHIATHGFFMSDLRMGSESKAYGIHLQNELANPLFRSGLLLSGANNTLTGQPRIDGEDGILTAYEAMNLNLDKTELIVMSACETGLGTIRNGEGVYGLQRAFIVAGAKNLIMSLWQVNDETTQKLMNSFYTKWLGGMSKLDAFSKAQLELKSEYPDPYHWGAFVILGN